MVGVSCVWVVVPCGPYWLVFYIPEDRMIHKFEAVMGRIWWLLHANNIKN